MGCSLTPWQNLSIKRLQYVSTTFTHGSSTSSTRATPSSLQWVQSSVLHSALSHLPDLTDKCTNDELQEYHQEHCGHQCPNFHFKIQDPQCYLRIYLNQPALLWGDPIPVPCVQMYGHLFQKGEGGYKVISTLFPSLLSFLVWTIWPLQDMPQAIPKSTNSWHNSHLLQQMRDQAMFANGFSNRPKQHHWDSCPCLHSCTYIWHLFLTFLVL